MKLKEFDYKFPQELIAQHPLPNRDASKMMVINKTALSWEHKKITALTDYLQKGDLLILNNSKVIPARLFGQKSGGKDIELLLLDKTSETNSYERWRCMTKRVRNYRKGDKLFFGISATATVLGREDDFLIVEFEKKARQRAMSRKGVPPLPPYIKRQNFYDYSDEDKKRYQTIYAKEIGSSAAPTAGLHFTKKLLEKISEKGVEIEYVTLHVGADTFTPVRTENIEEHKMHGESFSISDDTFEKIKKAKKEKRRIISVGTTTLRALETGYQSGITDIFIKPGYKFKVVDALLTNFHQPKSTLIMLVSAFTNKDFILKAYQEAIDKKYRLFSYGDCMLIL